MLEARWYWPVLCLLAMLPAAIATAQPLPRVTLTGVVTDAETGLPLADANVFIANTTWGTATDASGAYSLPQIPHGNYELSVSRLGYAFASVRIQPADTTQYDFALTPMVIEIGEVAVSAERPREWQAQLKKFTETFLGTSSNARKTEILNPEVLDFEEDERGVLRASASEPLWVVNEALGYRIEVVLRDFVLDGYALRFTVKPRFEEMEPRNRRQQKRWAKNRSEAYRGSLRHFLSALARGNLAKEGFEVYRVPRAYFYYPSTWLSRRYKNVETRAWDVDADTLAEIGPRPYEHTLRFDDYLQILFIGEPEEPEYARFDGNRPEVLFQTSWLRLTGDEAVFDKLGHLDHAYSVLRQGYFFWDDRVANMLPIDYGLAALEGNDDS